MIKSDWVVSLLIMCVVLLQIKHEVNFPRIALREPVELYLYLARSMNTSHFCHAGEYILRTHVVSFVDMSVLAQHSIPTISIL